jgi:hypothetical protein
MEFGSQAQEKAEEEEEEEAAEDTPAKADLAEGDEVYLGLRISIFPHNFYKRNMAWEKK